MCFVMLVIIGASNAVNPTDGLDGLAIVPVMIVVGCFALISYLVETTILPHICKSIMCLALAISP